MMLPIWPQQSTEHVPTAAKATKPQPWHVTDFYMAPLHMARVRSSIRELTDMDRGDCKDQIRREGIEKHLKTEANLLSSALSLYRKDDRARIGATIADHVAAQEYAKLETTFAEIEGLLPEYVQEPEKGPEDFAPLRYNEKGRIRCYVRWMIRRDMPEVLNAELRSEEHAWTGEDVRQCLLERNNIGMVLEYGDAVIGFMIYTLQKRNLEILKFVLHPRWRGLGAEEWMASKLMSKLSTYKRPRMSIILRERDIAGQLYFQKKELALKQVHRGHFQDTGEDGYELEYCLPGAAAEDENSDVITDGITVVAETAEEDSQDDTDDTWWGGRAEAEEDWWRGEEPLQE